MARRWHVNPETGEPGRCRALLKCRFEGKSEHFDTQEEAREAIEKIYETISYQALASVSRVPAVALDDYVHVFDPEYRDKSDQASYRDGRKQAFQSRFNSFPRHIQNAFFIYWNEERSAEINGLLWETIEPSTISSIKLAEYKKTVKTLDSYIAITAKKHDQLIFKGIPLKSEVAYQAALQKLSKLTPGDVTSSPGFVSTSVSHDTAFGFTGARSGIILEIADSSGGFVDEIAEEIILARNTQLVFMGYEVDELRNIIYVRMRQL